MDATDGVKVDGKNVGISGSMKSGEDNNDDKVMKMRSDDEMRPGPVCVY